jgi:C-terminal processing protease CtpA/Prc
MRHKIGYITLAAVLLALTLSACAPEPTPTEAPTEVVAEEEAPVEEVAEEPAPPAEEAQPVQITGTVEVSNDLIVQIYFFEKLAMLEDLTGFIARDFEYEQPLEAQIMGPVMVDEEGSYTFTLNLPAQPVNPLNDVDNDAQADAGVQIWQVIMTANLIGEPFLNDYESESWSTVYTSARIDSENEDEIKGGMILVWAPDDAQQFPTGFGDDNLLFTEDDPVGPIPAGYTLVDLDAEPFELIREPNPSVTLYEGDIVVHDLSQMGWSEAFDALFEQASREYPFTAEKGLDWDALYDEIAPRIAEAEATGDSRGYYLAMRDFSWAIPDGHVGLVGDDFGTFQEEISGSYGFAIMGLDDGRVIATIVSEDGPAAGAGMQWGAEIVEWNGQPIAEAVADVVPYSSPFSTEHSRILQQWRYLAVDPIGTEVEVTFQNPGGVPTTTTLTAVDDGSAIFSRTSVYYGFDRTAPPVEYEILDSGYGYVVVNSLSSDINLTIRLWQRAIAVFAANEVPAVIVDLRHNMGGAPIGDLLAGNFTDERLDLYVNYYYSDETGQLETFRPPRSIEPDPSLRYDGELAVLVSPACASACEDMAYVLSRLEQTRVFGYFPTNGIYGEVGRGQYELPNGYHFQIPTGLSRDMEGNLVIEGTGVVPDVVVPRTFETLQAEYVDGQDVVLDYTVEALDQPLGAGITPTGSPTFDADSDLIEALQGGIPTLEDLAREEYASAELSQAGQTYVFNVPLGSSKDVVWMYAWCTATQESFEDNWSKIDLKFTLNGEEIPLEDFGMLEGDLNGPCRIYYALLSDWPIGEHVLRVEVTFTAALNDDTYDYPVGTHVYEYHVYVAR